MAPPGFAAAPGSSRGRPLVSVVIPAYNAERYLGDCLGSVQAQRGGFELEVIVTDDGSTDRTADIAGAHDGVVVLRQPRNQGASSARNAGVDAARGEFVAFLDADDLWPQDKLAAQLAVLHRHADVALVFGDCRQFDDRGPRAQTLFESGSLGRPAWGDGDVVPDAYPRLLDDNFITTGSVVARRSALLAAGGFAEDLRLVEDLDLWLRIARRHPIAWCAQVCLLRRRHAANLSRDPEAMSLAFLSVLRRQTDQALPLASRARLEAEEMLQLAALRRGRGDVVCACGWAWRALRCHPRPHTLVGIGRALLRSRSPRALRPPAVPSEDRPS